MGDPTVNAYTTRVEHFTFKDPEEIREELSTLLIDLEYETYNTGVGASVLIVLTSTIFEVTRVVEILYFVDDTNGEAGGNSYVMRKASFSGTGKLRPKYYDTWVGLPMVINGLVRDLLTGWGETGK